MTVGGISLSGELHTNKIPERFKQRKEDLDALGTALDSGDLAAAQKAFAQVQQDMQARAPSRQNPAGEAAAPRAEAKSAVDSLSASLGSGDLSGARKALSTLRQNLQELVVRGRRAHGREGAGPRLDNSGEPSAVGQDFKALWTSLTSGDLTGAQKAFDSLLTDLQQVQGAQPEATPSAKGVRADFSSLADSLNAGDLAGAQAAYARLQQEMQQLWQRRLPYEPNGAQAAASVASGSLVNATA